MKTTLTTAGIILLAIVLVLASFLAFAQTYTGVSTSAGPGGTQTFMLGGSMSFSATQVGPNDASRLQSEGVRVVTIPAGSAVYVTAQSGQPLNVNAGQQPNMIVFGPGGFVGVGAYAGPGTGAYAGAGGAGASAGAGAGSVSAGTGAGTGGTMQMYSFSGSPGQTYLVTQQTDSRADQVLVVFQ